MTEYKRDTTAVRLTSPPITTPRPATPFHLNTSDTNHNTTTCKPITSEHLQHQSQHHNQQPHFILTPPTSITTPKRATPLHLNTSNTNHNITASNSITSGHLQHQPQHQNQQTHYIWTPPTPIKTPQHLQHKTTISHL